MLRKSYMGTISATIACLGLFAGGCTLSYGDWALSAFTLTPSDTVSTRTVTVIGAEIQPSTASLRLGYVSSVENNTPIVEGPAVIPDVSVSKVFEPNGTVSEGYEVGTRQ
jgi:hypothetical protein